MNKQPLVSVIVPNFNHGKYLAERIDSILNQTYKNLEVIILDDCSVDDSKSVIESYRNCVSKIVYNEKNSGSPFKQWKKGIYEANGDLIWIAESDDFCNYNLIETLISPFIKDDKCVLSFCKSAYTDINGQVIGTHEFQVSMNRDFSMAGVKFIHKYLTLRNYVVNASSALFSRKAAMNVNDDYISFRGLGDIVFWTCLSEQGNVYYFQSPLNKFRQHGNNTTIQLTGTAKAIIENLKWNAFLKAKGYYKPFDGIHRRFYSIYKALYIIDCTPDEQAEILKITKSNRFLTSLAALKHLKRSIFNKR